MLGVLSSLHYSGGVGVGHEQFSYDGVFSEGVIEGSG
jgi:hypothetical protein